MQTVLIIDDEAATLTMFRLFLNAYGYSVLTAENGVAALDACRSQTETVDLVLTDVVMPEMSGPECVAKLQRIYPNVGVVFMSGHAEPALDHRGVLEPGVALVHKPFTAEELAVRLRETLDSRSEAVPVSHPSP